MSGVAHAAAQPCGTRLNYIPTKTLRISNNTQSPLWVVMQAPNQSLGQDLWMQAVCGVTDWTLNGGTYVTTRGFNTTRLYRAYFWTGDPTGGIPPGGRIEVQVPFYTQLQAVTTDNLGKQPDQYIDWFNGGRTYLFELHRGLCCRLLHEFSLRPPRPGGRVAAARRRSLRRRRNGAHLSGVERTATSDGLLYRPQATADKSSRRRPFPTAGAYFYFSRRAA